MTTLYGVTRKEGIAIAVAAIVDAQHGVSGVSPSLLQQGLDAVKQMLDPADYPECVVVCDMLAMGMSVRIPGVKAVAIAAQSEADVPGLEPEVPCVIGLADLLRSVSHGDILIVDGSKGIVHIDPDPRTLIHYQEIEERHTSKPPVYIESAHIPARTQGGEIVDVYAYVEDMAGLAKALENGADGLIIRIPEEPETGYYASVLTAAAGKRVAFDASFVDMDLLRAVMRFTTPGQVSVLFPLSDYDARAEQAREMMEAAATEAFLNDLDAPQVSLGARAGDAELKQAETMGEPSVIVVDLRQSVYLHSRRKELRQAAGEWVRGGGARDMIIVLGDNMSAVAAAVEAGVRSVAVTPEAVSECKLVIRSIGSEEPR